MADSAVEPGQAGQLVAGRPALGKGGLIAALLHVDHREAGIRGEGVGGIGVGGEIVGDVLRAALLVGAHDDPDVGFQWDSQVLDALHSQQGGDHGALVVVCSAAVETAVHHFGLVGLGDGPALALVHHVQVAQNVQGGLLVVEVGGAHIALVAGGVLQPQLSTQLQGLLQGGGGALAEGLAGLGLPLHAADGHQPGDAVNEQRLFIGKIGFDLFLILHPNSPSSSPACSESSPRYL